MELIKKYPFRSRTHDILHLAQIQNDGVIDTSADDADCCSDGTEYLPETESETESDKNDYCFSNSIEDIFDRDRILGDSGHNDAITPHTEPKATRIRRKHNCIYCDIVVTNFSRHLERNHSDEVEVQKFLALNKNNPDRKNLIDKLRREGDFCTGDLIPLLRTKNRQVNENLLPCVFCKGYYSKKTLRRHVKRCPFNVSGGSSPYARHQARAQNMMVTHFGPNDPLRTMGVLDSLAADDVSLVAKKDTTICEVGRQYIKSHKDKHLVLVAKRQMRRLARLLIEARKIENNDKLSLLSLLHPSKFKTILAAIRIIAAYDIETKAFSSPSLALQMGTLIKKAISAAYCIEIQRDVSSNALNVLNAMKTLISDQYANEVSTVAGQNLNVNRFNTPTLIPMAEDIAKMKTYLDDLIERSIDQIKQDEPNIKAYRTLTEAIYCSLLLFNKRRVGELQRIPLDVYLRHHNTQSSKEFEKLLTPSEQILINSLKRVVIKGKRGKGVPVLFDKTTNAGVSVLLDKRSQYFVRYNEYLFGVPGTEACINGYQVLRKHASLALGDVNKTKCLTSTRLRKHLATICQILKMDNDELEQLAKFMGHTPKTHNEWYRLPSDIYQTAKVSKILLLSQNMCMDQFKGRSLSEIDIDNDILETEKTDSEESEVEMDINVTEDVSESRSSKNKENKPKRRLIPWSEQEKRATEDFFKEHIKNKKAPKKNEITALMKKYPNLFKNRNWATIKVYVQNKYK